MDPKYSDPKEKRNKKLTEQGLFPKNKLKAALDKIAYEKRGSDLPALDTNSYPQPTQLGNINSTDGLTLSLINPVGLARTGFNLYKKVPSIMQKVLRRGKKLAFNYADDAVNVISSLGQSN